MILLAESGSTKTDWVLLDNESIIKHQQTLGINPFHQNIESIINNISTLDGFHSVSKVFFYGAGCATDTTKQKIEEALLHVFPKANCEINSDVLAAAKSLCGNDRGIACIIGTGSNSCLYDGKGIVQNVRPLGYILGDEGSGAVMGKKLIADILKGLAPDEVKSAFYQKYDLEYAEIIQNIYRNEAPSRFLAQFTVFLSENIEKDYISNLVINSFVDFFERNIKQYSNYEELPVHFTGSIAHYFKASLQKAADISKVNLGKIEQSPLEGLINFHTEK